MKVSLVSITPNAEKLILYCARVSSPERQNSEATGLLKYCIDFGYWSIFEMANMVLEVETSRAISAQILRHKSFGFQEFSQRYAPVRGFEYPVARSQDHINKQGSIDDMSDIDKDWFSEAQFKVNNQSMNLYEQALKRGIAREQARFLLPGSARTMMYINGTARSWIHYIDVRCREGAQPEHREIALKVRDVFSSQFPETAKLKGWTMDS